VSGAERNGEVDMVDYSGRQIDGVCSGVRRQWEALTAIRQAWGGDTIAVSLHERRAR